MARARWRFTPKRCTGWRRIASSEADCGSYLRQSVSRKTSRLGVLVTGMDMVETVCRDIPPIAYRLASPLPARLSWCCAAPEGFRGVTAGGGTLGRPVPAPPLTRSLTDPGSPRGRGPPPIPPRRPAQIGKEVTAGLGGRIDAVRDGGLLYRGRGVHHTGPDNESAQILRSWEACRRKPSVPFLHSRIRSHEGHRNHRIHRRGLDLSALNALQSPWCAISRRRRRATIELRMKPGIAEALTARLRRGVRRAGKSGPGETGRHRVQRPGGLLDLNQITTVRDEEITGGCAGGRAGRPRVPASRHRPVRERTGQNIATAVVGCIAPRRSGSAASWPGRIFPSSMPACGLPRKKTRTSIGSIARIFWKITKKILPKTFPSGRSPCSAKS